MIADLGIAPGNAEQEAAILLGVLPFRVLLFSGGFPYNEISCRFCSMCAVGTCVYNYSQYGFDEKVYIKCNIGIQGPRLHQF